MKVLILGYSNIVRRRILSVFKEKKIQLFIASKSHKNQIQGVKKQFKSYEIAIKKCKPNLVYISLPNSKHFYWAKKSLNYKCNTIVDKPITVNRKQLNELINLSKKNNKLLTEATFFNYHLQMKEIIKIHKKDKGPYISAIPRLFNLKRLVSKKIEIKKNRENLITSIKFTFNFKEGKYNGIFKFGGKYKNQIKISNKYNSSIIKRVFSPPDDENLFLRLNSKKKQRIIRLRKDNCFRNFFREVLKVIKNKRYDFYHNRMKHDVVFRTNLIKKIV